jgi:hypothetical protein
MASDSYYFNALVSRGVRYNPTARGYTHPALGPRVLSYGEVVALGKYLEAVNAQPKYGFKNRR